LIVLRTVVIAAAAILTCVGIGLIACGVHAPGWQVLAIGVIVLIGTLFERWQYRQIEEPTTDHWQRTGEQASLPRWNESASIAATMFRSRAP
jgi:hypothetical protein